MDKSESIEKLKQYRKRIKQKLIESEIDMIKFENKEEEKRQLKFINLLIKRLKEESLVYK